VKTARILALAVALVAPAVTPAFAQPGAAMLGKPLDDGTLPAGTVSVRVIAGDASVSVSGTDVTLVVNGAARIARTDAEGRATFTGLPGGATVQAKVVGAEEADITSEQFVLPDKSGIKLLMSTLPFQGTGGTDGMPAPREISGFARPDSADPPGTLTVRLTYDDFNDKAPDKHPVILVGYTDDEKVVVYKALTDAAGRAEFTKLDTSGRTAYYAMTILPRGDRIDRLVSQPFQMLPGLGTRMMLSAAKRSSTEPSIDDYDRLVPQYPPTEPGVVLAEVRTGGKDDGGTVELVSAQTGKVLATENLGPTEAPTSAAQSKFSAPQPDGRVPQGMVAVIALSASGAGLEGATLELLPAEANPAQPMRTLTNEEGLGAFEKVTPGRYQMTISYQGKTGKSEPMTVDVGQSGAIVQAVLAWFDGIPPRTVTLKSVPAVPEPVYLRLKMKGTTRMGIPFLPAPGTGMFERFVLGDRMFMSFFLHGSVDDRYYAVNGTFTLVNSWWTPYRPSDDGVLVPLPRGFTGGVVGEDDKTRVTPDPGYGFRIRRPLPPGGFKFQAGFSLPIVDGVTTWSMDLPWGTGNSTVNLLDSPGMTVDVPPGAKKRDKRGDDGSKWLQIAGITIEPQHSMSMVVSGLPVPPQWKIWTPRIVGLIVLVLLIAAAMLALRTRHTPSGVRAAASAKIQSLMDELVELERKGQGGRRKDQILGELEKLWDADARTDRMA
jgi:hypothetical protein